MRTIFFLLLLLLSFAASAQIQNGYVRTAGTAKHKGVPLADVVIRISGSSSSVQSNKSGLFIMAISGVKNEGDGFHITSVRKSGYELLDKDALKSAFIYSKSVPIEIVLISTAELIKTRQQIEEQARKNATKRYDSRIKELKKQLDRQKITAQEYAEKIHLLEKQMESFEGLIAAMADHYARTDYDKLDSLNASINECIANGDLEKADSLIDTKGDVKKRAIENIEKGYRLHDAETQLDSLKQRVNKNGEALEQDRKRLDMWKKQEQQIKI